MDNSANIISISEIKTIKNLVLSGGELKCVSYIGIIRYLEETGYINKLERVLGVSGGAIFALSIVLGYNSIQLERIARAIDLKQFQDIDTENIFSFFNNYGFDSGRAIDKIIQIIIKNKLGKTSATFKDLYEYNSKIKLIITGSNLSKEQLEYFSVDTTPDMPIHLAVRISISVPIYFQCVRYNNNVYVDGGVFNNYPIDYFKNELSETLGIVLLRKKNKSYVLTFDKYLISIINGLSYALQNHMANEYKNNTIVLELNNDVFDLTYEEKTAIGLINDGYNQFKEKIKKIVVTE